jgi:hypothetical protein
MAAKQSNFARAENAWDVVALLQQQASRGIKDHCGRDFSHVKFLKISVLLSSPIVCKQIDDRLPAPVQGEPHPGRL